MQSGAARFRFGLRGLLWFVVICSVAFAVLFPAVRAAREAALQSHCVNNLQQIGEALRNYHDTYGCFPSPYVADANGKPMHSWRVAIIPFLSANAAYSHYDVNKPWNSPTNLALARKNWVYIYSCPSANQPPGAGFTNYVMIVGPTAASRAGEWRSLGQISDGPAETVIVAEIADSDIFWSEPRDLMLEEMSFQINDKAKPSISSHHAHGAVVVFADGRIFSLDKALARVL